MNRRAFLGLSLVGLITFALILFRRPDLSEVVQQYFGFHKDYRDLINKRFAELRVQNAKLYRDSVLFFGLQPFFLQSVLNSSLRRRVLSSWIPFFFRNRDIAWQYVNYPSVGEYQICNGLVRTP